MDFKGQFDIKTKMIKIYTRCVDCNKEKFHDSTQRCQSCRREYLIRENERLKQKKTLSDY